MRILEAWDIRIPYRIALQSEMISMLAKYIPGAVWTPAARTLALRRSAGVTDTPAVLASILVEAGLSAISGVIVFVVSLAWVRGVDAPLLPLVGFALLLALALHPRVFRPLAEKLLRPFGAETIEPVPFSQTITLLIFYCGTWLIAGAAVYFMLRSLGTDVGLATIPVSRRRLGGRRDRRSARGLRSVRPRRARGVDVRLAARGHHLRPRARRDAPEPARDHRSSRCSSSAPVSSPGA